MNTMKEQMAPVYATLTAEEAEARYVEMVSDKYVGNKTAVDVLGDVMVKAAQDDLRIIPKNGVLLLGPPSTGKTTLARLISAFIEVPYVESEANIKDADQLWVELKKAFAACPFEGGFPLVEVAPRRYKVPPCMVFIDEAHKLPDRGEWLLKPTEAKDRTMILRDGKVVDTRYVFFMLGTTKPDEIDAALLTRLRDISLKPYSLSEVGEIIRRSQPLMGEDDRMRLARMARGIPRVAISYAEEAVLHAERRGKTVLEAVQVVSDRLGMDQNNLTAEQRAVLYQLKMVGRIAKPRLALAVGVTPQWLEDRILPGLWQATEEMPALVRMGSRGVELTEDGESLSSTMAAA